MLGNKKKNTPPKEDRHSGGRPKAAPRRSPQREQAVVVGIPASAKSPPRRPPPSSEGASPSVPQSERPPKSTTRGFKQTAKSIARASLSKLGIPGSKKKVPSISGSETGEHPSPTHPPAVVDIDMEDAEPEGTVGGIQRGKRLRRREDDEPPRSPPSSSGGRSREGLSFLDMDVDGFGDGLSRLALPTGIPAWSSEEQERLFASAKSYSLRQVGATYGLMKMNEASLQQVRELQSQLEAMTLEKQELASRAAMAEERETAYQERVRRSVRKSNKLKGMLKGAGEEVLANYREQGCLGQELLPFAARLYQQGFQHAKDYAHSLSKGAVVVEDDGSILAPEIDTIPLEQDDEPSTSFYWDPALSPEEDEDEDEVATL